MYSSLRINTLPINITPSAPSNPHTHTTGIQIFLFNPIKMVKFSKQFEGQLIPEWKEAFVDYWQLKKELKRFHPTDKKNVEKKKQNNLFYYSLTNLYAKCSQKNKDHQPIQVCIHDLPSYLYI